MNLLKKFRRYFHRSQPKARLLYDDEDMKIETPSEIQLPTVVVVGSELCKTSTQKISVKDAKWEQLCVDHDKLVAKNPDVRCAKVNKTVHKAVQAKKVRLLGPQKDSFDLTPENYHNIFQLLLHAEEAHEHIDMRKFDQFNARVRHSENQNARNPLYEYDLAGLSKGHPNLILGDTVILDDGVQPERFEIKNIDKDTIVFGPRKSASRRDNQRFTRDMTLKPYTISFVTSGVTYDRYADNLRSMGGQKQFARMIFESQVKVVGPKQVVKIDLAATSGKIVDARLAKCNPKQKQAIQNILEASCRPNLYILFGPPGTGKTFTVVETVIQIHKRNPRARILISAGSNNCVDHLAEMISKTEMIPRFTRLSSQTHFRTLEGAPKYYTTNVFQPNKHKVVLTTNMMTCRLTLPFDYVFVDEAGHAHVPESMLPMSKVATNGCFVLAGDPKQLGPVIKCREVGKLGLEISLLERLFKFKLYSRVKGEYNAKYITKLTSSYRCDPRILGLCNKLFYDGDLESLGRTPPSILRMLGIEKPLVFSPVNGQEHRPRYSTSRGNHLEADYCVGFIFYLYKMGFEPHQIGVITPYILQKELIIEKFDKKLRNYKSLLNERFKLPAPTEKETESKRQHVDEYKSKAKELFAEHLKQPIDDLAFLTKALVQLKLQSKHSIEQSELKAETAQNYSRCIDWHCKIDTVDAFQGNEREVIIISTVRSPERRGKMIKQSGFLADPKRFNVAISRAKWLVIVLGSSAVLECCDLWKQFESNCCRKKMDQLKLLTGERKKTSK